MFKSSAGKFSFALSLIFIASCSVWQTPPNANQANQSNVAAVETKREIPFSTVEPEIYQTEIVIKTFNGNEASERKILTARNGTRRVTVFDADEKSALTRLNLAEDTAVSIYPDKKIYAEFSGSSTGSGDSANDFLTTEWLNQKTDAEFENLGIENGLSKFRVKLGDAENSNSEILIFVDDNLKVPVRQEFYSVSGEQKTLTVSIELQNFKYVADENLFVLPKDFRKVAAKEFQESLRQK